jgi:hypothetical protein
MTLNRRYYDGVCLGKAYVHTFTEKRRVVTLNTMPQIHVQKQFLVLRVSNLRKKNKYMIANDAYVIKPATRSPFVCLEGSFRPPLKCSRFLFRKLTVIFKFLYFLRSSRAPSLPNSYLLHLVCPYVQLSHLVMFFLHLRTVALYLYAFIRLNDEVLN